MPFWFELIILTKTFDMTNHGVIHYLLGIQIIYDKKSSIGILFMT